MKLPHFSNLKKGSQFLPGRQVTCPDDPYVLVEIDIKNNYNYFVPIIYIPCYAVQSTNFHQKTS